MTNLYLYVQTTYSRESQSARGLQPDANFQDVIRQYIDDCKAAGLEKTALKGL